MSEPTVNVIGVGNTLMGDDGVGPRVIERLAARGAAEGVSLHDAGLAVSDVLGMLDPADPVIIIDAVRGGGDPGTLYQVEVDAAEIGDEAAGAMVSLHELSALPALRLEALTGRVFRDVTVLGVEPAAVEWGADLSPEVAGAVDRLVEVVLERAGAARANRRDERCVENK